ncbi:VOC family protein [Gordonia sp. (in: high G+C Gram-positive bacteria)]|uniref:VOC family protein n=1 Tax=Gordonia sp. (in: high G+C Gram-positive bacteria) TaxID=84139 RepID=UPI003C77A49E
MSIRGLNHAVLYVSDVQRSVEFYTSVLGFEKLPVDFPGAAFLRGVNSANDHDLGLFQTNVPRPPDRAVGLYHLAWEVATLSDMAAVGERMAAADALTGAANHAATKALYGRDPDGIEFEVTWLVPDELVAAELVPGVPPTRPLDLRAEIEKYGADTLGGPRLDPEVFARIARGSGG